MNSSFPAYVDTISQYSPSHINALVSLEKCFFVSCLGIIIVILEYSVSLARLGISFIYMWIKRDRRNRALI